MSKLFVANWKEHPATEKEAVALAKAVDREGIVMCPPHLFIAAVSKVLKKAALGAQDGFYESTGPYTGEVSMAQLKEAGCAYVIVGHSSRRALGESDSVVARKVAAAIEAGLIPVLCVGETFEEHVSGKTKEVVDRQVRSAFSLLPAGMAAGARALITYEPVWAISTNQTSGGAPRTDTPEASQTVVRYLEGVVRGIPLTIEFLYGGSVNAETIALFARCTEFSGFLVGAASLDPKASKVMLDELAA